MCEERENHQLKNKGAKKRSENDGKYRQWVKQKSRVEERREWWKVVTVCAAEEQSGRQQRRKERRMKSTDSEWIKEAGWKKGKRETKMMKSTNSAWSRKQSERKRRRKARMMKSTNSVWNRGADCMPPTLKGDTVHENKVLLKPWWFVVFNGKRKLWSECGVEWMESM